MSTCQRHWVIFSFCFLVFFSLKVGFICYTTFSREQPVEVDDSYVHMWKTVFFNEYRWRESPAQADLRQQVTVKSDNDYAEKIRLRTAAEVFSVQTPLYTIISSWLHDVGLSNINTYRFVAVVGIVMICCGMAFWLTSVWSPVDAGVALLCIAPVTFGGQGLHMIVPSNIALGLAFFMWGIINRKGVNAWPAVIILSLVVAFVHPIGRIYSLMGILLYLTIVFRQCERKHYVALLLACVGVLVSAFVPYLIRASSIEGVHVGGMGDQPILSGIVLNFRTAVRNSGGTPAFVMYVAVCVGFISSFLAVWRSGWDRKVIFNLLALLGLASSSLFYVLPGYPATLFKRVWVAVLLFFLAAISSEARGVLKKGGWNYHGHDKFRLIARIVSMAACVSLALILWFQYTAELRIFRNSAVARVEKHDFELVPDVVRDLLDVSKSGDTVLYMDEIPMLYSFVNGSHSLGAAYYPLLFEPSLRAQWLNKTDYIVSWNKPYMDLVRSGKQHPAKLYMNKMNMILCDFSKPENVSGISLFVRNRGGECVIPLFAFSPEGLNGDGKDLRIVVPELYVGWVFLDDRELSYLSRRIQILFGSIESDCELLGVNISGGSDGLMWPWKQRARIKVCYRDGGEADAVFDPKSALNSSYYIIKPTGLPVLSVKDFPHSLRVLSDKGALVLLGVGASSGSDNEEKHDAE